MSINNGDVVFGAKKDIVETNTSSKSTSIGLTLSANSPMLDRLGQVHQHTKKMP